MTRWLASVLLPYLFVGIARAATFSAADIETARALRDEALAGSGAYEIVTSLTTEVGPRPAGSAADRAAVGWAEDKFAELGLAGIRRQPVPVPHWERGTLEARTTAPFPQPLVAAALGGSIGTPERGIEADVVRFETLEALRAASRADVEGRIVFLSQPTQRATDPSGYAATVYNRVAGPSVAGALGASALVIRSVGTTRHRIAHTGALAYTVNAPKIPAAALSNPDADLLERMLRTGRPVKLFLKMTCRDLPYEASSNVIAEVPGTDLAEEIVLLAAHLDSWDLGTGAIDDGAGVAIVMATAALIRKSGLRPRRTIRVVLFASEEYQLAGAGAYARLPPAEIARHAVALEADSGGDRALALASQVPEDKLALVEEIAAVLAPLGIERGATTTRGGADIFALMRQGVPALQIAQDWSRYLDAHHSPDDTLDRIDREQIDQVVAAYAATAFLAAQAEGGFGRIEAPERTLPSTSGDDRRPRSSSRTTTRPAPGSKRRRRQAVAARKASRMSRGLAAPRLTPSLRVLRQVRAPARPLNRPSMWRVTARRGTPRAT
jgi:carboxypeptidase Q